jgi:membrane-associated phospholipid phosphatase
MNRARGNVLLTVFLLVAPEAFSGICYARPQENQADRTSQSEKTNTESTSNADSAHKLNISPAKSPDYDNSLGLHLFGRFFLDQEMIWSSPAEIRLADADWLMPFGLAIAGTLATDTEFSKHLSNSTSRLNYSSTFSNYGLGAMGGLAGGLYLWGQMSHDDHKRETGFLAAEAAADSLAVVYSLNYSLGRERPFSDNYNGNFWKGGNGFPSEHAAAAWSIAGVVAHEYPGILTEFIAYGMASAVSASRLTSKQHFPTDVLVGSAIGWLSGQIVYRQHHDPELGGSPWETFAQSRDYLERDRPRQSMGTTFVPLDSWVYPALNRLAALGYVHTEIAGLSPWTRMECARLTEEAREALQGDGPLYSQAGGLEDRLRREFSHEIGLLDGGQNLSADLDSVYVRAVSISGAPLTDGYHFGQTVSYDFGRPFERGTNGQAGGAVRAEAGPIAIYVRAEYQHAPSAPAPSDAVREIIALRDFVPEPPAVPVEAVNRIRLLDAYIGVNLDNWQILVGKQSLSWAPGLGGSFLWSDNAEPVDMVRVVNSEPFSLPGFLKYLGPMRIDQFFGRLEGGTFIPHPFIYGNKINFKPLPNLEFGFGRTVTIGGRGGTPLTPGNFIRSFFGQQSTGGTSSVPGDSHSSFDWTFNVPKVRNYLVFYGDLYADDDPVPFVNQPKNPFRPGIFITRIPGISKLDLHIEATSTESPGWPGIDGKGNMGNLNYWNAIYHDGYTNGGNLIGNVVGRDGQAYQGWLTYWVSPTNTLQFTYKNSSVDQAFIPGGGAWQDYSLSNSVYSNSRFYVKSQVQYEHISHYPILFRGVQRNLTAIVEMGFTPMARRQ